MRHFKVGMKLRISMAELQNETLVIPYNSVRRAGWDARLGKISNFPFLVNLKSIRSSGGRIGGVKVIVTKVYPLVYKVEDKTVSYYNGSGYEL